MDHDDDDESDEWVNLIIRHGNSYAFPYTYKT